MAPSGIALDAVMLAAYVAVGMLAGWVLDRAIASWARRLGPQRPAAATVSASLRNAPVALGAVAGGWSAMVSHHFDPRLEIYLRGALIVLGGLVATAAAARIVVALVGGLAASDEGPLPSTSIFANLTRVTIWAIGALAVLGALGISITPMLTALGVGGLAVALGLQDTLSNLFAGLSVIASKQIRTGDFIELDTGQLGTVEDITWRYTTLRMISNNRVVVPNARLAQAIVTNYQLSEREFSVPVIVGVAYGSDLDFVERVTADVASGVMADLEPGIAEYEPTVRFREFGDSAIEVGVFLRVTDYTEQHALRSEFIKRLHRAYAEAGIEIPLPQRVVRTRT